MSRSRGAPRSSSAVAVYVVVLVAFQVFLLTVAVEAFATADTRLATSTAAVSVALFAGSLVLWRTLRS